MPSRGESNEKTVFTELVDRLMKYIRQNRNTDVGRSVQSKYNNYVEKTLGKWKMSNEKLTKSTKYIMIPKM